MTGRGKIIPTRPPLPHRNTPHRNMPQQPMRRRDPNCRKAAIMAGTRAGRRIDCLDST
jgi:hypothetical protein